MTLESKDTPDTPERAQQRSDGTLDEGQVPETVSHTRNWKEVCANNAITITPSPHTTSFDLAEKSQDTADGTDEDGEADEAQVTENDAFLCHRRALLPSTVREGRVPKMVFCMKILSKRGRSFICSTARTWL